MLSKLIKHHQNMSTATITKLSKPKLSEQDIHKINLLIPRLIFTNNTPTAIRLITTALSLTQTPKPTSQNQNFLSLNILTLSISTPNMILPMQLLNSLKHTPQAHPHIPFICELIIKAYLRDNMCKEAFKVFSWMLRVVETPLNGRVYGVLVNGLCANGDVLGGLRVLREMVKAGFLPGREARERVYRSLLRDAKVREAMEVDEGLCVELLDRIIRDWTE